MFPEISLGLERTPPGGEGLVAKIDREIDKNGCDHFRHRFATEKRFIPPINAIGSAILPPWKRYMAKRPASKQGEMLTGYGWGWVWVWV